jgi:hypothetical protein
MLELRIRRADVPLDALCGFASRRSRKRGFVFVSKVLGKHYPVRPRVMQDMFDRLAVKLIGLTGPVLVIALAETATGLGQGVYESLWRQTGRDDLLFLHSTRYRLRWPLALQFDECHSHATAHLLYEPAAPDHRRLFHRAASLVLIDDEISTGRTLTNLARAYQRGHEQLQAVHLVCLTDWRGRDDQEAAQATVDVPTSVHSLLEGSFDFTANVDFDPGPVPCVNGNGHHKDFCLPSQCARLGWQGPIEVPTHIRRQAGMAPSNGRLLVLGTGEFAYPPYRLAHWLAQQGADVWYQSTTRSPLQISGDLRSVLEFTDNYHDDMPNFLYNVVDQRYDQILIGYETQPLPADHRLAEMIRGQEFFF